MSDTMDNDTISGTASLVGISQVEALDALDTHAGTSVIVTVNRRLSRHLTDAFTTMRLAAGDSWWDTPDILPLGNWLEMLHDAAIAGGACAMTRLAPLSAARTWRAIITQRGDALLDPDAAASAAQRAWRLAHAWHCLPDEQAYLSRDAHAFREWSARYAESLAAAGALDEAMLPAHLGSLAASGQLALPERVILAGYLSRTPELDALCAALSAAGVQVSAISDDARAPGILQSSVWPDDETELSAVADAVYQHLESAPDAVLGVVVPDLGSRRSAVRRAFDARFFPAMSPLQIEAIGRPYDVSAGESLADTALARTALALLELAWRGVDRQRVSMLLLSPHLAAATDEAAARQDVERTLRNHGIRFVRLSLFRRRLGDDSVLAEPLDKLGRRIGAARRDGREQSAPGVWAERFSNALAAFGWPGEGLGSEEHQAQQAVHGVFDDLQSLDDGGTVSLGEALGEVGRLMRERQFQPETPQAPVRILGRLESHGQQFDALWVVGLDSERWPAAAAPTPYLSISDQSEAGMPEASARARLDQARLELAHWARSAPAVGLSCAHERAGQPLVPSAALNDPHPRSARTDNVDPIERIHGATALERIDDMLAPAVAVGERVRGGASLFRDQAECPFRAFARHRIGLRPLEETDIGLDPRRVGTFLHRALEIFWTAVGDHATLMAMGDDVLDGAVVDAVTQAFDEDEFLDAGIGALERPRVTALLHEWLEGQEMNRAPFTVEAFEQKVEFEHGGVAVNLIIDRIDRVDGRQVVIDYKSGRSDSVDGWSDDRIVNPQLPLYALANDEIDGVAFARVARGDCRFIGLAADDALLPGVTTGDQEWNEWRAHWRSALDVVADEVSRGVAGVTPAADACRFCDLLPVCRYAAEEPS